MTDLIPVTSAPLLDPGQARRDLQVPAGLTVEQIVALALPVAAPNGTPPPKLRAKALRSIRLSRDTTAPVL